MAYQVTYAGMPLHDYVKIRNVKRTVIPPRENFTKNAPSQHGEFYMGYKYGSRKITLECTLIANNKEDYIDVIKELAFILDVDMPKKMIINDDPDRYMYAVIDGTTDIEKIRHNGKLNLNFICYDPYLYASEEDWFEGRAMKVAAQAVGIDNSGSTPTYPLLNIGFTQDAHFLQCTDAEGRTVLVGQPPDVDKPSVKFDTEVLKDYCEVLTNWTTVGNIIDDGIVDGDLVVNGGGYGFTCSNYGSNSNGWHGGARRRNLNQEVKDFKVEVHIEHNSHGDVRGTGAGTSSPSTSGGASVQYKIKASGGLRLRSGRGTNTSILTTIPNGKIVTVTDIQNNWGKTTYNSKTGYISMSYTEKYTASSSSGTTSNSYKPTDDLRVRSGRGTSYKVLTYIPKGKVVTVTDIKSNWGKVTYNGKTGYCSMKYMTKVSTTRADEDSDKETAEDRMGKVEVYGFDKNGNKLFKMSMKDTSEWYEHSYPEIQIGSKVVLTDSSTTPNPKTITVKDEKDEDKTVTKKVDSGKYGKWNEFVGWFTIERQNNKWKCKVEKINSSGSVIENLESPTLSENTYPTGSLSNIVIWFGKYKENIVVDAMNVSHINVTNLGEPPKVEVNKPIFKNGDNLLVDFGHRTATLQRNGQAISMMSNLDIGSQFFSCPTGYSEIAVKSDDRNIDVSACIRKRWI